MHGIVGLMCGVVLAMPSLERVPPAQRAAVQEALERSGDRAAAWRQLLADTPAEHLPGVVFLLRTMPAADLRTLSPEFVTAHVAAAYRVRKQVPWGAELTDDLFLPYVLPYANVNERRETWRSDFAERFLPAIVGSRTPGEAAVVLNRVVFENTGVRYHPTKRPKPDQSPGESIAAGYASCTGLSILLIDACRSVGVPARFVGTPSWTSETGNTHPGNHSWVEVWDGGWHYLGASEVSELDRTWFFANASKPDMERPGHGVFAAVPGASGAYFPMVWAADDRTVAAVDVTRFYTARQPVRFEVRRGTAVVAAQLAVHTDGHLVARGPSTRDRPYPLAGNTAYVVTVTPDDGAVVTLPLRLESAATQPVVLNLPAKQGEHR